MKPFALKDYIYIIYIHIYMCVCEHMTKYIYMNITYDGVICIRMSTYGW